MAMVYVRAALKEFYVLIIIVAFITVDCAKFIILDLYILNFLTTKRKFLVFHK